VARLLERGASVDQRDDAGGSAERRENIIDQTPPQHVIETFGAIRSPASCFRAANVVRYLRTRNIL